MTPDFFWVDTHCHLDLVDNPAEALHKARQAGVRTVITIGTSEAQMPQLQHLAEYHNIPCSLGIHPDEAVDVTAKVLLRWRFALEQGALNVRVVALGETGLDFYHQPHDQASQIASFHLHCGIAQDNNLPVVVHARQAGQAVLQVLAQYPRVKAVMHSFTETLLVAEEALAQGHFISFSGIVTFKNAAALRHVVMRVPRDRVLVETDAPYLAPEPYRGKKNQPAFVVATGTFLASLLQCSPQDFAHHTSYNAQVLFPRLIPFLVAQEAERDDV